MAHQWFQWHQVQAGQTYSGIAGWWYGDSSEPYWRRLWAPNRQVTPDPDEIYQWQWIKLPYWGFWYLIHPGDNLSQIAEWIYADANAYWIIVNANPGTITDPDNIQAWTWIWVP